MDSASQRRSAETPTGDRGTRWAARPPSRLHNAKAVGPQMPQATVAGVLACRPRVLSRRWFNKALRIKGMNDCTFLYPFPGQEGSHQHVALIRPSWRQWRALTRRRP
jgi:hypothetical protein